MSISPTNTSTGQVADSFILRQARFPRRLLLLISSQRARQERSSIRLSNARGTIRRFADAVRDGWVRAASSDIGSCAAAPLPPPTTDQRTLIETPPPATLPDPPLPALKPGTELSLAEIEALAEQASPKAPVDTQPTASQRAMGRMAGRAAALPARTRRR